MLTRIKRIRNLGVFADFSPEPALSPLKACNIIYGPNGTGKTTLTRLFEALRGGGHPAYPDLQYSIEHEGGVLSKGSECPRKIRVFNADFVSANLNRADESLPHIIILGEENKALADEMAAESAELSKRETEVAELGREIEKLEEECANEFTAIAKTISEARKGQTSRTYRRPEASNAFSRLREKKLLSEADLELCQATVRQTPMAEVPVNSFSACLQDNASQSLVAIVDGLVEHCSQLTRRTAQAATLQRLLERPDIATWIETGQVLHSRYGSLLCEYCGQSFPDGRLKELADHFSEDDQRLKADVEAALGRVEAARQLVIQITFDPAAVLFSEFRPPYDEAVVKARALLASMLECLDALTQALREKLTQRTRSYDAGLEFSFAGQESVLEAVAEIQRAHNVKAQEFEAARSKAAEDLESHYLSTIWDKIQTRRAAQDEKEAQQRLLDLGDPTSGTRSLGDLQASIRAKRAKISSAHKASAALTEMLRDFLGRTDLTFEAGNEAYVVTRQGKPAKRLSEGEKTAIAFIYFVVQLRDQDFDVSDGIVVIDDPISSLDANSMYQAFALLKHAVQGAKQVFILTHNFQFLRLLLSWRNHHGLKRQSQFYMLRCVDEGGERRTSIRELDNLLQEHRTEYAYLFKVLYTYQDDGTIETAYHIPNVARKVLESFLDYYMPSADSPHAKLAKIEFDEVKKASIVKFTNESSHHTGDHFDPAIVAETHNNVRHLLEMISSLAPRHYEGMEALCQRGPGRPALTSSIKGVGQLMAS